MEGGALQGMSRALLEEVTWDDQKVTSFDWATYRSLPLGFDIPKVETVLINRREEEALGAGRPRSRSPRRPSGMQSSMQLAPVFAKFRSRRSASKPRLNARS
jgi:hypothetical protein